ncbi:MAG TPA: hypothetical protein VHM31_02180, partial [Polyangia bacterium]|nr:hypothetical protein [Polyangia bacterium]
PAPSGGGQALDLADDQDRAAAPSGAANRGSFAGAAPAPAAAPRAKGQAAKKAEAADQETFAAPAAGTAAPRSAVGRESAAARADRLFAQARWAEAAIAYRELLRDDPRNADAPRWRRRLTACEAAARAP